MLSKEEFLRQLNDIVGPILESGRPLQHPPPLPPGVSPPSGSGAGSGFGPPAVEDGTASPAGSASSRLSGAALLAGRKNPLPSREALVYGKDWTARVPDSQGETAFREFDKDGDGKVGMAPAGCFARRSCQLDAESAFTPSPRPPRTPAHTRPPSRAP